MAVASPVPVVDSVPLRLARRGGAVVLLLALCGYLFFYGLDTGELYRTEGLRALLAVECLRGGDWVVPKLYGEPLLTKPPGLYVAIALLSLPTGTVSAATARLPSAIAATLTVLLVFVAFRRRVGWTGALVAALVLPASVMWLERVPSAEIDMLQLAWVTAALLCFLRALEAAEEVAPSPRRQWLWWQLALLCVAGGFLTKWTAPAFFYLTAVPLLAWRRRLGLLLRGPHLTAAFVAAVPCLAWMCIVAARVGGDTLADAIRREALPHLSPAHHTRSYPWHELATYPLLFLLTNLPWSAFALLTLRPGFGRLWDERGRRLLQLLHCWTWVNLLFWTLVPGHRPRHALPLQPGLAGLAALAWTAYLTGRLRWPLRRIQPRAVFAGLVVLWLVAKVVHVHAVMPGRNPTRAPRAKGEALAARVPPGETLYLFHLKDEGILFYYGRPARRLAGPHRLPAERPCYCLLQEAEWRQLSTTCPTQVLDRLRDEQGAEIVLIRVY